MECFSKIDSYLYHQLILNRGAKIENSTEKHLTGVNS